MGADSPQMIGELGRVAAQPGTKRVTELHNVRVQLVFAGAGKCGAISISEDLYTWDISGGKCKIERVAINRALEVSFCDVHTKFFEHHGNHGKLDVASTSDGAEKKRMG